MKRVAICISGAARTWADCWPFFEKQFINHGEFLCDIFIHTWNYQGNLETSSFERYPSQGTIDQYLELYQPKASLIEDLSDFNQSFDQRVKELNGETREDKFIKRYLSMLYSIYKSFKLIHNPSSYDYIIRTRADLTFARPLPPDLTNFIDTFGSSRGPGDVFAIGSPKFIQHYSELFLNYLDGFKELGHINTETLLPWWLNRAPEGYHLIDLGIEIKRPKEIKYE